MPKKKVKKKQIPKQIDPSEHDLDDVVVALLRVPPKPHKSPKKIKEPQRLQRQGH